MAKLRLMGGPLSGDLRAVATGVVAPELLLCLVHVETETAIEIENGRYVFEEKTNRDVSIYRWVGPNG